MRRHHLVIPFAALLATLPLLLYGPSCGHDLPFHLQSWLDAAAQLRHGTLWPHWAFSPAWQAGEPRFVFYPPLSWLLGALLTFILPVNATPIAFTWIALTAAGFSMHRLARHFGTEHAALFAACLYLANPYMLLNAWERFAAGELLSAAWIPLLLLAVLRERPTASGLGLPLALLWLTNAPSAVMGCYAAALLALFRIVTNLLAQRRPTPQITPTTIDLALTYAAGFALGLGLPAFYLLPAAYERRFVSVSMAIIPNLRYQDNFLFSLTANEPHNTILHRISLLALLLLGITLAALATASLTRHRPQSSRSPLPALVFFTAAVALLMFPVSTPLWAHLPELAFLQFPWRLLTLLSAVLAFAMSLISFRNTKLPSTALLTAGPACALGLAFLASPTFRQRCDPGEDPRFLLHAFQTHHGAPPTDEYTPVTADNDVLRSDDPGFWLSSDPAAPAPGTVPNPVEADPLFDGTIPFDRTLAGSAPSHLRLNLPAPQVLILNLRDYPSWQLRRNGVPLTAHLQRDDGLLAVNLPAGVSSLDLRWHTLPDTAVGLSLSGLSALVLSGLALRSRKLRA